MSTSTRTHHPRRLANGTTIALVADEGGRVDAFRTLASPDIFICGWLYEAGWNEDGEAIIRECGSVAFGDEAGWRCEAGHEHVSMQARYAEGWDYFEADEIDAARRGTFLPACEMRLA